MKFPIAYRKEFHTQVEYSEVSARLLQGSAAMKETKVLDRSGYLLENVSPTAFQLRRPKRPIGLAFHSFEIQLNAKYYADKLATTIEITAQLQSHAKRFLVAISSVLFLLQFLILLFCQLNAQWTVLPLFIPVGIAIFAWLISFVFSNWLSVMR